MLNPKFTRRKFIASASTLVVASQLPGAETKTSAADDTKIALDGGAKSVKRTPAKVARFGQPERERLEAMLGQDALFYWNGPQTKIFLDRFQKICPLKHVMPCSSGTAALHIAVAAAGIAPGDEVITTPITDMGTVIGILFQQAVPVFADLEPNTFNLSVADVERRITPKTKAIIAVHLGGNPCDLIPLKALADKHKLVLIEDCAQSWGAIYRGKPIGTVGHIACFSLQSSKQLTCGDGGLVASSDERFGPLLQKFGDKGMNRLNGGKFEVLGTNYRMSEPQAAVAAGQLTRIETITGTRAKMGELLTKEISGIPGLTPHFVHAEDRCTFYFYMMRVQPGKFTCDRDKFVAALRAEGVQASAGYIPAVLYQMDLFRQHNFFAGRWPVKEMGLTKMDYNQVKCPEAEAILKDCLRVTIHESMDEPYMLEVGAAVRKVAKHFAV
ncbi:MAG: putative PLP-dependent enzyme involved in cell wall biosis [Verrucomicrobiales bacterium]|nr:putative PLP-dependent enzyme involved in cell wall biosis [Verrucomicrobiales bacterium]